METTGVVRRIDELGRIVIPKEIRRSLRIKEGDSLEICVERDMVALKKHSSLNNLEDFAEIYADSVNQALDSVVVITDNDSVIACAGLSKKEYIKSHISEFLEQTILERKRVLVKEKQELSIIEHKKLRASFTIHPIVSNGEVVGLVIILAQKRIISDLEDKTALVASQFLGKHVEQ